MDIRATDESGETRTMEQRVIAARIVEYDLVLGFDWLRETNPEVDWSGGAWRYRTAGEQAVTIISLRQLRKEAKNTTIGML